MPPLWRRPPFTRNKAKQRDPELEPTKKGKQWYFGLKAHLGVDSVTGLTHSAIATSADVARCHDGRPQLHSDQGWHYQHPAYRRLLTERSLVQSMSRKGNCLDNAAMESFFGTLKAEYFHLNRFETLEQLQRGIDHYIHYYNHERIKLTLKGLSPVQYRSQALNAG
jgi:transposase InsO family protein